MIAAAWVVVLAGCGGVERDDAGSDSDADADSDADWTCEGAGAGGFDCGEATVCAIACDGSPCVQGCLDQTDSASCESALEAMDCATFAVASGNPCGDACDGSINVSETCLNCLFEICLIFGECCENVDGC